MLCHDHKAYPTCIAKVQSGHDDDDDDDDDDHDDDDDDDDNHQLLPQS